VPEVAVPPGTLVPGGTYWVTTAATSANVTFSSCTFGTAITATPTFVLTSGTTTTGLTPYDLTAPAGLLYPRYTPTLRDATWRPSVYRYEYDGSIPLDPAAMAERHEARQLHDTELRAQIEAGRRARQREHDRWRETQQAARRRAVELLESWLTPGQLADFREHRRFEVVSDTGTRWRINCSGQAGNVERLDEAGEWESTWCAHPPGGLPDADAWLAQRLILQTDEAAFLAVANCHDERPGEVVVPAARAAA